MTRINGTDIRTAYGAYLIDGSYASMLVFPKLKNIVSNDWFEEDGMEVDLSGCTFGSRSFSVKFGVSGAGNWERFMAFLRSSWGHVLEVSELGVRFSLRFVSVSSLQSNMDASLTILSVQYSDDDLSGYLELGEPNDDGSFGVKILTGLNETRKMGKPKSGLVHSSGSVNGSVADMGGVMRVAGRQLSFNAVMRAASSAEFMANYYALASVFHVQSPTALVFNGKTYMVVFSSCTFSSVRIGAEGDVWALMVLSFVEVGNSVSEGVSITLSVDSNGILTTGGGEAEYWYDFDTMELWASAALASDIKYSVGADGYMYVND